MIRTMFNFFCSEIKIPTEQPSTVWGTEAVLCLDRIVSVGLRQVQALEESRRLVFFSEYKRTGYVWMGLGVWQMGLRKNSQRM